MSIGFIKKATGRDQYVDDTDNPLPVTLAGASGATVTVTNTPTTPLNVTGAVAELSTSNDWKYAAAAGGITDTSDVVLHAAAGSGQINTINALQFVNTAAAVSTEVVIKDGSTVIWRGYAPQSTAAVTQLQTQQIKFSPPLQSTANTALNFACITTASKTYVNAQGSVVS